MSDLRARRHPGRALRIIEYHNGILHDIDLELDRYARRQPGCRALMAYYSVGTLIARDRPEPVKPDETVSSRN